MKVINKTLYIHIGTGKTGTTALQKFLFDNKDKLSREFNLKYAETALFQNKHRALDLNARRHDAEARTKVSSLLESLNKEIELGDCDRYLISDEDFPGLTQDEVCFYRKNIDSNVNIKVIVYLRRQDEYLESWYNQIVKTGRYNAKIEDLVLELERKKVFYYNELISRWENAIGEGNVIVKIYQRSSFFNGNIYDDFLSVFGLSSKGLVIPHKEVNMGLTRDKIMLIRKLSLNGLDDLLTSDFIEFVKGLPSPKGDSKYILSPDKRMNFYRNYEGVNKEVSDRFFDGINIFDSDFSTDWQIRHAVPDELFVRVIKYLKDR